MTDEVYEAYLRGRSWAKLKFAQPPGLGEDLERQAAFAMGVEDALRTTTTGIPGIPTRRQVAEAVKKLVE